MGPALPTLTQHSHVSLEQGGYLFTSMSMGYLLSAPIITWLRARISTRVMLFGSPWLVIVGMALLALGRSFTVQLCGALLLGLGQSGTQVGYNVLFGSGPKSSGVLNRLNAFFGLGALIGPLMASWGYAWLGEATPAFVAAILLAAPLPIGAFLWKGHGLIAPTSVESTLHDHASTNLVSPWTMPVFWLMLGIVGLYVGIEISFSGWVTEFSRNHAQVNLASAALSTSAFFIGVALSRYVLESMTHTQTGAHRINPLTYVAWLLGLGTLAMSLMLVFNALWVMLVCAFVVGFALGPIYPTLIATGIQLFPRHATLIASGITSAGSIGAIALPPFVGAFLTTSPVNAWTLLIVIMLLGLISWGVLRVAAR